MADFQTAYAITRIYEGGYSDNDDDAGGETYKGVARRYHPSWSGWRIIDSRRSDPAFPTCLDDDPELQQLVLDLFKATYWDMFWGDTIPDQAVANEMFDTAVNMGVSRAVTFLQTGLNVLNRNGLDYPDIVEDGRFGPNSLRSLERYLAIDSNGYLLKVMVILRGMHYLKCMRQIPSQEKFARGWLNRVNFKSD